MSTSLLTFWCLFAVSLGAQETYEIGPRDVIRLVVIGQETMTGEFEVDPDGMLTLPVLGKVKAGALTAPELERKLTTLLADGYLKRPQVAVTIREFRSQTVFVTGEVQKPGPYALRDDKSMLALLGALGGPGPNAGHEVLVVRPASGELSAVSQPAEIPTDTEGVPQPEVVPGSEVVRVSLQRLQAGEIDQNVLLRAGDTVYFPPARQVFVTGQVARTGPYKYQEGMTVLQAITLAGGVTPRGSSGRIKILRTVEENGEKVRREVKVKMEDPVLPDDLLVVPERFF